ncbi:Uncharacterised protein [Chryseobacterium nakagawai]|uniref:Uncharacterized protein n=1 Tax=Chryseobacterium nakagawai TaxID=1241982 RepID=A0AAD0YLA9_CHRNA|nr:hypothetical protein [Chryseobacterium nakagawai]AZA91165.1 hypothetical protein EG343_11245 [Chryseobacterium nakagawai]VEH22727.1 Uncharacterised protein [Chryseobacterium nakagawai]
MTVEELKKLWGKDLFEAFADHFTNDGWLTTDWGQIIENEIPQFDNDWNDNPRYKDTYQRMYLLDHVESDCGKFIKPID